MNAFTHRGMAEMAPRSETLDFGGSARLAIFQYISERLLIVQGVDQGAASALGSAASGSCCGQAIRRLSQRSVTMTAERAAARRQREKFCTAQTLPAEVVKKPHATLVTLLSVMLMKCPCSS